MYYVQLIRYEKWTRHIGHTEIQKRSEQNNRIYSKSKSWPVFYSENTLLSVQDVVTHFMY